VARHGLFLPSDAVHSPTTAKQNVIRACTVARAREIASPWSGTGLRNFTRDARLHDVAAPRRTAPRRAAPRLATPRRAVPRRAVPCRAESSRTNNSRATAWLGAAPLSHVMLSSATRLITATFVRACVRDAPLRVFSRGRSCQQFPVTRIFTSSDQFLLPFHLLPSDLPNRLYYFTIMHELE